MADEETITVRNKFFNDYFPFRNLERLMATRTTSTSISINLLEVIFRPHRGLISIANTQLWCATPAGVEYMTGNVL